MSAAQLQRSQHGNLVAATTSFVGREDALASIADDARLVTITGPGGIGKTRLALEWASRLRTPVWLCDLSDATDLDDLAGAVAQALDISLRADEEPGSAVERLADALAGRGELTLLLDDFDRVVSYAVESVGVFLSRAPDVRIVITSRERLRLPGEAVVELSSLPEEQGVALFASRAGAIAPKDRDDVLALVRKLEGIPLAIELCAARTRILGVKQLLERVERGVDVLAHGPRGTRARHATLRATIAWSWDLLAESERIAFASCAVFRGGFDLVAAEAVLGSSALGMLEALHAKSLIEVVRPPELRGEARYRLLESVRAFLAEQVAPDHGLRDRHARHYAEVAEVWARGVRDDDDDALARLGLEVENVLAAHEHARIGDAVLAARLALAVLPILLLRGRRDLAMRVLDESAAVEDLGLSARARLARGDLKRHGDLAAAEADVRDASELARKAGDRETENAALRLLGGISRDRGDFRSGERFLLEAVASAKDPRELAEARIALAALYRRESRLDEGLDMVERAMGDVRALADTGAPASALRALEGRVLVVLGLVHDDRGDLDAAQAAYESAIERLDRVGDRWLTEVTRNALALLYFEAGRVDDARAQFQEGLSIARANGLRTGVACITGNLAVLDFAEGRLDLAIPAFKDTSERCRQIGHRHLAAGNLAYLGAAEAQRNRLDNARAAFEEVRKLSTGAPAIEQSCTTLEGFLDLAEGRVDEARKKLATARAPGASRNGDVRIAARLLERALPKIGGHKLSLGPDARWFSVDGAERIDLLRQRPLRLVLQALVARWPNGALTLDELFVAGWEGEKIAEKSAHNRVHVTLSKLRKLGLSPLLQSRDDGYALDPEAQIESVRER
ncbi:MAG: ATP-binding protein [Polyangiales bacterium]